jgi:hypothetical protein
MRDAAAVNETAPSAQPRTARTYSSCRVSDEDWQTSASRSPADRSPRRYGRPDEREVSAYASRLAQRDDAAAAEVLAALQASRELHAELAIIVDRLDGWRRPGAVRPRVAAGA